MRWPLIPQVDYVRISRVFDKLQKEAEQARKDAEQAKAFWDGFVNEIGPEGRIYLSKALDDFNIEESLARGISGVAFEAIRKASS